MYTDFQFTLFSVITDYQCRVNFGYTPTLISNVVYTDVIYNLNEVFVEYAGYVYTYLFSVWYSVHL